MTVATTAAKKVWDKAAELEDISPAAHCEGNEEATLLAEAYDLSEHIKGGYASSDCAEEMIDKLEIEIAKHKGWLDLPSQVQTDLEEWYNVSTLDGDDREHLTTLWQEGRFNAWDCPTCKDRVRCGEPEDWADFQGVNQPDYASYPGKPELYIAEIISKQCDDCRSSGMAEGPHEPNELEQP